MARLSRIALAVAATSLNVTVALSQNQPVDLPSQRPFLRIDAGMHSAIIRRIGVDASCTLLATGSEDKTIRLWRLPDGQLLRTLRPPIGEGNEGKIYAVAVAPDGGWLAAGGWTRTPGDHWIYIFQTATGSMIKGPSGPPFGPFQVIANIAISPDGRRLAVTFGHGGGVKVWERQDAGLMNWKVIGEDTFYSGRAANGAAFDKTGVLYTVADDGQLRRYASSDLLPRPKTAPTRTGKRPNSVSINARDNRLAIGFADTVAVDVYDPTTLAYKFNFKTERGETRGTVGLSAASWSMNGDQLFAGGTYAMGGQSVILVWDQVEEEHGVPRELEGSSNAIMQLVPCSDEIAVAAGDPAFALLNSSGARLLWRGPIGADMRNKVGQNFLVSPDGRRVRFGLAEGGDDPVLFDLDMQRLIDSPERPNDLFPAEINGLPVEGWKGASFPKLAAEHIKLDDNERSQSLAIAPDKQQFVLGCDYYLRAYDKDGGLLWPPKQAPGIFWGVNISRDGHLVVAAAGDGTIRWYRMNDGRELLALFVQRESREWVAWTPKGYFMASPKGGNLIGWHVNRGWNQSADFFALSQFRDTFDRPDIVSGVLAALDEDTAIDEANAALKKKRDNEDVTTGLPPVITITSPSNLSSSSSPDTSEVTIEYSVRSPSRQPVTQVVGLVDGRPVPGAAAANLVLDAKSEATGKLKFNIGRNDRTISLIAISGDLPSTPAVFTIRRSEDREQISIKPNLYALIIGVGEYEKVSPKLAPIPENDADAIAAELTIQGEPGGAFAHVEKKLLKDSDATRVKIMAGLQWLSGKTQDSQGDIALVYFSGHGATTAAGALLLPGDFDPEQSFATGLPKTELLGILRSIKGRVIFIVDACHAAAELGGTRMLNPSDLVGEFSDQRNGITAFASSQGKELSRAAPGASNSYFTQAFVDGLRGRAAYPGERIILTIDMPPWLKREVPRLTKGQQTPEMFPPMWGSPPPLAAIRQ